MAVEYGKSHKFRGFGLLLLIVALLSALFLSIVLIKNCATPVSKYIDDKWELELPAGELVYHDAEETLRGNGPRLTVYQLDAEPTDFLAGLEHEKNTVFESAADAVIAELSAIKDHNVAENYRPDWTGDYYWLCKGQYYNEDSERYYDNLYLAYFPDTGRLFICEDL